MKQQIIICDICKNETADENLIPKFIKFDKSDYEVALKVDSDGDICIYCFIKAVNKLDNRPKAAN
jgi:hypothetical protein